MSIVILAFNEGKHLPGCLASLAGRFDDVHILDSGSTDDTRAVAETAGARVHSHQPFEGFGTQRNWAIDHIECKHPWVLHLDADEHVTDPFCQELREIARTDSDYAGYFVPNKLMLDGQWLRYSGDYPTYQVRLFRTGRLRFENYGHGQREVTEGTVGKMREPYLHFAYCKGLDHWFAKHAVYARQEAEEARRAAADGVRWSALFGADTIARRRAIKRLVHRLPFRSALRILYILVLKRGFLDGRAGWTYAKMMATYEMMIAVHLSRRFEE